MFIEIRRNGQLIVVRVSDIAVIRSLKDLKISAIRFIGDVKGSNVMLSDEEYETLRDIVKLNAGVTTGHNVGDFMFAEFNYGTEKILIKTTEITIFKPCISASGTMIFLRGDSEMKYPVLVDDSYENVVEIMTKARGVYRTIDRQGIKTVVHIVKPLA